MAKPKELLSAPVIISQPKELVVGAGSNISLSCSATGMGTLDIVWFQDQQNLNSTRQTSNSALDTPPTSTLLLERRYEIAMEFEPPNTAHSSLFLYNLKLNDTGLFICSVKNEAGTSYTNHSLIVNDSPPARLRDLAAGDLGRRSWWWQALSQNSDTQLGLIALIFVIILLAAVILLLIFKNYSSRSSAGSSSGNSKSRFLASFNLFSRTNSASNTNQKHSNNKPPILTHTHHTHHHHTTLDSHADHSHDHDDDCSSSSSSSSCRKNSNHTTTAHADLEGFIEHLRSGIINMDYHTMSPVGQFNNQTNTSKNNYQQSAPNKPVQQPPHYFGTVDQTSHHQMHHFPSASNTSSLPYYSQGSVSMSTTLSNLSPNSANIPITYQGAHHTHNNNNNNEPSIINCDMQHRLNGVDQMAPPTNTTTTSYTSDYQSGYGDGSDQAMVPPNSNMIMPPMYYETAPEQINYPSTNQRAGQTTSMLLNGAFPMPGVPTYLMLQQQQQQHHHHHHHQQQLQPNRQQPLVNLHHNNTTTTSTNNNNRNSVAARMLANRALCQDQNLSSSRPSL